MKWIRLNLIARLREYIEMEKQKSEEIAQRSTEIISKVTEDIEIHSAVWANYFGRVQCTC